MLLLAQTEAWLVDALTFAGVRDTLQSVLARGQVVGGAAMLGGSLTGGFVAQAARVGVPYIMRSVTLGLSLLAAFIWMKDLRLHPQPPGWHGQGSAADTPGLDRERMGQSAGALAHAGGALLQAESTFYGFYALQPYLLQLYGNPDAFAVASLSAAIMAGAQMLAGVLMRGFGRGFRRRSGALIATYLTSTMCLLALGLNRNFALAVALVVIWGLSFALGMPIRQTYINGIIPSQQRATVLSFDNLMSSAGAWPSHTGAGPSSRHLWLRPIVRGVCGDPGGGGAVPPCWPGGKKRRRM